MSNTFLIAYAIIINCLFALHGTIGTNTIRAKVVGFIGFFMFLPALFGFVTLAVYLSEDSTSLWWPASVVFFGTLITCGVMGAATWLTDKVDA